MLISKSINFRIFEKNREMEISEKIIECPSCRSRMIKKNGRWSNGKQNYRCKPYGRQFVESSQEWHVTESDKQSITERISLNGICRVVKISSSWLQNYLKELYANLPDDLHATVALPDQEAWLDDRMDEEIIRLKVKKKLSFDRSGRSFQARGNPHGRTA